MMKRTVSLLTVLAVMLAADPALGVGFRLELPDRYDAEIYVDDDGPRNGSGTQQAPFRTIGEAMEHAAQPGGPLAKGQTTRINVAPGTYPESVNMENWGEGAKTLLTVEGADAEQVIIKPSDDHPRPRGYFEINGKSAMVFRHLTFTGSIYGNGRMGSSLRTGSGHSHAPAERPTDWLIEHCVFRDGEGKGVTISFVDHYTIRHVKAYNQEDTGMVVNGRHILMEDVEIYNTNTAGKAGFGNGGLTLLASDLVIRRMHIHDIPIGYGLRQDHAGENFLIEDSIFEKCQRYGVRLETAKGPVTLRNCIIRDNTEAGIYTDTGELTVTNCLITGNPVAIKLQTGRRYNPARCAPPGYGCIGTMIDLNDTGITNKLPLWGVERMIVLESTLEAPGPDGRIFTIGKDDFWKPVLTEGWVGFNNTYVVQGDPSTAFPTLDGGFTDLAGWQKLTGQDAGSRVVRQVPSPGDSPLGYQPPLDFGRDRLLAGPQAVRDTVKIDAPRGTQWQIVSTRDWATVQPTQGTGPGEVTVSLTANDGRLRRHATLALASDQHAWDLMIVQEAGANPEPVATPKNLKAQPTDHEATITWDPAPGDNIYGYGINWAEPGGKWLIAPEDETKSTQTTLTGLSPGTEYKVRVITIARDGVSEHEGAVINFTTTGYRDPCEIVGNGGFEQGVAQWRDKQSKLSVADVAHTGEQSLLVTTERGKWDGVRQNVKAGLVAGGPGKYIATAWVRPVKGKGNYKLEMSVKNEAGDRYVRMDPVANEDAWEPAGEHGWKRTLSAEDGWKKITGEFDVAWGDNLWDAWFVVQGAGNTVSFYVDDVSLRKVGCKSGQ